MYAEEYGNGLQTLQSMSDLPPDQGLETCRTCGHCGTHCPNGIAISERIDRLLKMKVPC